VHENPIAVCGIEREVRVWQSVGVPIVDLDPFGAMRSLARLLDKGCRSIESNNPAGLSNSICEQRQKDAAPATYFQYMLPRVQRK
jgi:hypothetical protein